MVGKTWAKRRLKQIRRLKTWQLVIILALIMVVVATAWRMNNVQMLRRLDAVLAADEDLDEAKAQQALEQLRDYSLNHMNASTGLVSLVKIYERDAKKELERVSNAQESSDAYKQISVTCDPNSELVGQYWWAYVECWKTELAKLPPQEEVDAEPNFAPKEMYEYNFVSPLWAPDFAGWTTLVAILLVILIILKIFFEIMLKIMLKRRLKA